MKKEIINKKIYEKDEAKINYEKRLGDIKTKRGIHFSIDYLKEEDINFITFSNLKYKNQTKNISVYYNNSYDKFSAITYEINQNQTLNNTKEVTLIQKLEKEYKLRIVVNEIKEAHAEYKNKLLEIDKKYSEIQEQTQISNDDLELKKSLKRSE